MSSSTFVPFYQIILATCFCFINKGPENRGAGKSRMHCTCSQQFVQELSLKPKINITFFIKPKMIPGNFGVDANARFPPTLVVGLTQLTRA